MLSKRLENMKKQLRILGFSDKDVEVMLLKVLYSIPSPKK